MRVSWFAEGIGDKPWKVVVVRTSDDRVPAVPGDGVVVATDRAGEISERRADLPAEFVALTYRVFVLDEADGVVAASAPQTLRPPDS